MYRLTEIQDKLLHLVGWEQAYNPEGAIQARLTRSESGLYFQNQHALLTLNNIRSTMPEDFSFDFPAWNMIPTYPVNSRVTHNGEAWIAIRENRNEEPKETDFNDDFNDDFSISAWRKYNLLTDYLTRETKAGIATMVQRFINIKSLQKETRNLIETRPLFDGAGRLAAFIENRGMLCGYEVTPIRSNGITTKISRIGFQTTGATGKLHVYVFHSNFKQPVREFNFDISGANGYQWFETPDLYLPYQDSEKNAGGSWFICYNQADMPAGMDAIDISRDWSKTPCGTCNGGDVQTWRTVTQFIEVHPFRIKAPLDFKDYPEMWDIEQNLYNGQNYGMNLEFSIGCDLTDFIIEQRGLFADVLSKQVAYNILRKMTMNPDARVNRNQVNISRMDILYELDGNTSGMRPGGMGYELEKAYKALSLDTRSLDRICLGCNNGGVRYTTV